MALLDGVRQAISGRVHISRLVSIELVSNYFRKNYKKLKFSIRASVFFAVFSSQLNPIKLFLRNYKTVVWNYILFPRRQVSLPCNCLSNLCYKKRHSTLRPGYCTSRYLFKIKLLLHINKSQWYTYILQQRNIKLLKMWMRFLRLLNASQKGHLGGAVAEPGQ